jgi:uncharacterized protein (DUF3084 family)
MKYVKKLWIGLLVGALAGCETSVPGSAGGASAAPGVAAVSREVERLARENDDLRQAIAGRDRRQKDLERELAVRDAKLEELAGRLDALEKKQGAETQSLEQELARIAAGGAATRDDVKRILDTLRTQSLVPNAAREVPKIAGRVMSVERDVVLLDVGRKQGVRPSYEFTIAHAGRPIAKVVVEQVDDAIAGGRVVFQKDGEQVREGDEASTRP